MDLRQRRLTAAQLQDVEMFIRQRKLAYQPFEFSDALQVGEGQRFRDGEFADRCGTVLWEGHPAEVADLVTKDPAAFREANRELRRIYDGIVDFIVANADDDVKHLSFAEFGCNSGYFLHSLAARGAGKTTGYDFTENSALFRWFNEVLGIPEGRNEFRFAEWDSLQHRVRHATFDEADVCLSIAVTCHLADPLHHLAFLCSQARRAVFFWCPVNYNDSDGLSISFGAPGKYPNSLSFPVDLDNDIRLSPALIRLTLERCGFGKLIEIEPPAVSSEFHNWFKSQLGFVALRTSSPATVYTNGRTRRKVPADALVSAETPTATPWDLESAEETSEQLPVLVEHNYRGFNIVRFQKRVFALDQMLGSIDVARVDAAWLAQNTAARKACVGKSVEDVQRQVDHWTIDKLQHSVQELQGKIGALRRIKRLFRPPVPAQSK
jgi:SAM-dependent methyltransferase